MGDSMKYSAIFFDLDGTVVDSLQDIVDAVNHTMDHFGLPRHTPDALKPHLGWGVGHLMRAILPDFSQTRVDEVLDHYRPYYARHAGDKSRPFDGILPMMQALKEQGLRLAIISNKPDRAVQELSAAFFPGLLELSVGESPSVRRKPAPDTVLTAAAQIGLSVDQCVYVGDSEVDLQTAGNAGLDFISVTWGFRDEPQLLDAGAVTLVHTPKELRDLLLR